MQNHNKLLLEGLAERGHEITVISTCHPDGIHSEQRNNLTLYYLSNTQFGSARKGWKSQSLKMFSHLNETKGFDLICSQGPFFPPITHPVKNTLPIITLIQAHEAWVTLSEINQFITLPSNFPDVTKRILSFIYYYLKWEISNFQKSDLIIPPSHEVAKSLQSWYFIKPDKIKTIYNAVDTKHFKPDSKAKRRILKHYPQLKRKKIILFLSHVTKQKGLHLLIKILPSLVNHHPNLMVVVVGGGDYLKEAKRISFELSNIRSHGLQKTRDNH
jgi:glycosyltransferase involved in cell wall biosynthesis